MLSTYFAPSMYTYNITSVKKDVGIMRFYSFLLGIIQLQIITVNMGNKSGVDITIPCGGRDPPYTYIHSESAVVAENINEYYIATDQYPPNNGEKYCCATNGGVTCYQLNITCVLA